MNAMKIEIRQGAFHNEPVRELGVFMGSFDPFHRGHEWIADQLLDRFGHVLLLIPARHFEKTVRFPRNATFQQRLDMLAPVCRKYRGRLAAGITREVLFLRLADHLADRFPGADVAFGMGNETHAKVMASRTWFERSGLAWTGVEEDKLADLQKRIIVFGRTGNHAAAVRVPGRIRGISSTRVRDTVGATNGVHRKDRFLPARLEAMVSPETLAYIFQADLYA